MGTGRIVMKVDPESNPIAFELARSIFVAVVSLVTTAVGSQAPTLALTAYPGTPARTLNAAAHYLALLAELGSGPDDRWAIGIEIEKLDTASVFVETATNTNNEIVRAHAMLEDVLAAARLARPVPTPLS